MNTTFSIPQNYNGNGHKHQGNGQVNGHTNGHIHKTLHVNLSPDLLAELKQALEKVGAFGSVEVYVQDFQVTQITARSIRKTKHSICES